MVPDEQTPETVIARGAGAESEREQTGPLFPVVAIGASAGGLESFTALLRNLPVDSGMAFMIGAARSYAGMMPMMETSVRARPSAEPRNCPKAALKATKLPGVSPALLVICSKP